MKHLFIYLITATFLSSGVFGEDATAQSEEEIAKARHDGIYYFQQQTLPIRVLNSGGSLFRELETGLPQTLVDEAQRIVDEKFAKALKLKAYSGKDAYVIIFPEPTAAAECYFALIKKEAEGFQYYVLEKGINFFGIGDSSRLYMWDQTGQQVNFGQRKYSDLKKFVREVLYGKEPRD